MDKCWRMWHTIFGVSRNHWRYGTEYALWSKSQFSLRLLLLLSQRRKSSWVNDYPHITRYQSIGGIFYVQLRYGRFGRFNAINASIISHPLPSSCGPRYGIDLRESWQAYRIEIDNGKITLRTAQNRMLTCFGDDSMVFTSRGSALLPPILPPRVP